MLDTISIFLNLLRFDLWPKMWSILENVPCALEKKVYSFAFGWKVLKISMRSVSSNVSFKTCFSLVTLFCWSVHGCEWGVRVSYYCVTVSFSFCVRQCLSRVLRCSYVGCIGSVQFSSVAQSCLTLCGPMDCIMPGFPVHHQLPEFTQTHVHWVADAIQPSHPLLSPSPPAFNLSQHQGLLQWVRSSQQVAKVLNFSLNISPSSEYSGLISFIMDWLDLLAVQGTLKSLLQHYSSKASILWCSAFFVVQISHPYMTTGKKS